MVEAKTKGRELFYVVIKLCKNPNSAPAASVKSTPNIIKPTIKILDVIKTG